MIRDRDTHAIAKKLTNIPDYSLESNGQTLNNMGLKSVLRERFLDFGDKTSIAGLNNAVHSKSRCKIAYWMVLFLLGTAFTFKGIADVFINYYEFEVTTSTDVTTKESVTFPAISICNLNKY